MTLSDDIRQRAEQIIGYAFNDPALLEKALTHSSATDVRMDSNERMEFLGDAVLDLVVCEKLYLDHPDQDEGDLTKLKSAVVSRRTCAQVARSTGLADLLIVGKGIVGRREFPASLAAAVYESVVAAVYLDGGFEAAKRYVLESMRPQMDLLAAAEHAHNYKALLQHHVQKSLNAVPHYELLDEKGPDHSKCFEICVLIEGRRFDGAWGPNKKTAEQKAALVALRDLELLGDDEFDAAVTVIDAMAPQTIE